jgi:quercetin dioxygenase-like cupin family protein
MTWMGRDILRPRANPGAIPRRHTVPATTTKLTRLSFDQPTETRPFADGKGQAEILTVDGSSVGRATFAPGWRWSEHVKPIAKTDSCESAHFGYVVSGSMTIEMTDGSRETFRPGDLMICPPGHDAWTEGSEACVCVDWTGVANYAKPS